MKKILMLILFVSSVNAAPVLTQEVIHDGMLNGLNGVFKEITGQNNKAHEENCKSEYETLYARHSIELIKQKSDNNRLKNIAKANNIKYKSKKIKYLPIRNDKSFCILYWDYLKSSSHVISELQKENTKLKILLSKRNINYTPLLKTKTIVYSEKEVSKREREKAKEALKKQMSF